MRHVKPEGRSGFTLIELLVVVAIIALLISILLPSLARARELAKRTTCAANMSGMGKGLHTYANDGNQGMPVANHAVPPTTGPASGPTTCNVQYTGMIGSKRGSTGAPSVGDILIPPDLGVQISTARNLWTLVRSSGSTAASFICPSCDDAKNDEDNPQDFWDFGKGISTVEGTLGNMQGTGSGPGSQAAQFGWNQCSYGYQIPYGASGKPSAEGDQRSVLAADKGPWSANLEGGKSPAPDATAWGLISSTSSPDDWRKFNSPNHGGYGDGEGQNVLYADSHADWQNKAVAGPGLDNIYTGWQNPIPSYPDRVHGQIPTATGKYSPAAATDAFIYP